MKILGLRGRFTTAGLIGYIGLATGCGGGQGGPAAAPSAALPSAIGAPVAATPQNVAPVPSSGAAAPVPTASAAQPIAKSAFGKMDGKDVELYTLTNAKGLVLKVMTYGATITEFDVPDKQGKLGDIVVGFDTVAEYEKSQYFGATVGRVANRIANATFKLEGKTYKLAANNKPHHLHGGTKGWDKVVWTAEPKETPNGPSIKLTYVSKDGEEGYPGTVTASSTYTLTNDNELKVEMEATTDKTTLVNMAHHTYWNIGGNGSGTVEDQVLTLNADKYTPGSPMVPDGKIKPVKGTPFDFTSPKAIGKDLKATGGKPIGYDHNFVVNGDPHKLRPFATLKSPKSCVLTLEADQPGLQFYTGNFMDGTNKGKGVVQAQYTGLCLESQKFPNSINVPAWKDEVILKPGQTYHHTMDFRFTTE